MQRDRKHAKYQRRPRKPNQPNHLLNELPIERVVDNRANPPIIQFEGRTSRTQPEKRAAGAADAEVTKAKTDGMLGDGVLEVSGWKVTRSLGVREDGEDGGRVGGCNKALAGMEEKLGSRVGFLGEYVPQSQQHRRGVLLRLEGVKPSVLASAFSSREDSRLWRLRNITHRTL